MIASCVTQTYTCCSGMELQMNTLHCSLDTVTLTCGLFCYHPYGNTIIIALCNITVVVYVANTQATLLTMCRCGSELHMHSLIFTMRPCGSELRAELVPCHT